MQEYIKAIEEVGLWESERILFTKYFNEKDRILDLGCGTGRTTIALFRLNYRNILGLDVSEEMLAQAVRISDEHQYNIPFVLGDATDMEFEDESFDGAIFAFNGLMQIPWLENREKAFKQISRVLKKGSIFIFTTHDMEDRRNAAYWSEERYLWKIGRQNPKLAEFGDLIYKNGDHDMFMHVPSREEILTCLKENNFEIVEDRMRASICKESRAVLEFSDECRFWIVRRL